MNNKSKEKVIKFIRIFHTLFIFYFFIAVPLAIFGVLAKYPLLNFITFATAISTVIFQIVGECPLTDLESKLLKKNQKVFTIRLFKWMGFKISRIAVTILWAFIFGSIIISYLVY